VAAAERVLAPQGRDQAAEPAVAPQGLEEAQVEAEQIAHRLRAVAALLPGPHKGLSFQSLSPRPRVDSRLLFFESRGFVLFVDIFSL
jgi:hypothetical protein